MAPGLPRVSMGSGEQNSVLMFAASRASALTAEPVMVLISCSWGALRMRAARRPAQVVAMQTGVLSLPHITWASFPAQPGGGDAKK